MRRRQVKTGHPDGAAQKGGCPGHLHGRPEDPSSEVLPEIPADLGAAVFIQCSTCLRISPQRGLQTGSIQVAGIPIKEAEDPRVRPRIIPATSQRADTTCLSEGQKSSQEIMGSASPPRPNTSSLPSVRCDDGVYS